MKPLTISILLALLPLYVLGANKPETDDVRKGNKEYNKGNYSAAAEHYLRAKEKAPYSPQVMYNLGDANLMQLDSATLQSESGKKMLEQIRTDMYKPLSESTDNKEHAAAAHYNIGNTYMYEQNWDKAIEHYKQSLRLSPTDSQAKENLVYAQAMKQQQQQDKNNQNKNQDKDKNKDKDKNQDKDKDKNKDQDKDKDKNQDQNKDKDKDKNKDQDKDNQNQDKDNQNQDQNKQPSQGDGSEDGTNTIPKADAERILQAIGDQEARTQEKVKAEQAKKAKQRRSDKNW